MLSLGMECPIECDICGKLFNMYLIENHETECLQQNNEPQNEPKQYIEPQLSEPQIKALEYITKKSKHYSKNVKPLLFAKLYEMGYAKDDFKKLDKFVRESPIIIHFSPVALIHHMLTDTHYRNYFEIKGHHGTRVIWENTLFNKIYDTATPFERVKYGPVNITHDPRGVISAHGYGDSYMVLSTEVKKRTSFVFGDSSMGQVHMCTFDGYHNLLYYIPDDCLKHIMDLSIGKAPTTQFNMQYVEAQYHGPIRLDMDIDKLVINNKYVNNIDVMNNIKQFCEKNNVEYMMGDI
jgi:hypothetical protein